MVSLLLNHHSITTFTRMNSFTSTLAKVAFTAELTQSHLPSCPTTQMDKSSSRQRLIATTALRTPAKAVIWSLASTKLPSRMRTNNNSSESSLGTWMTAKLPIANPALSSSWYFFLAPTRLWLFLFLGCFWAASVVEPCLQLPPPGGNGFWATSGPSMNTMMRRSRYNGGVAFRLSFLSLLMGFLRFRYR
ncbi:hypothetical protein FocTR4_00004341 [Fusarium oxysporum f. sp. cubense]|uniref:Uncharacterized protein n=1 Tax=Fusarium oxysporum f. sp. cubense TaxID=61366 RepID=A0A5C6TFH5_FUSOC|nr:hypothetical protein FocTR4_00004341 [Fusarium oxysporum f. sp. cubense]